MDDKLKRHIQDTLNTLQLSKDKVEYLKSCMDISYRMGEKSGLEQGQEIMRKAHE